MLYDEGGAAKPLPLLHRAVAHNEGAQRCLGVAGTGRSRRRADQTGIWVVDVHLAPGRHEYGFLIDGREWRPDPAAPRGSDNEYGPPNSVVLVSVRQS